MAYTLFLSDTHLQPSTPQANKAVLQLLQQSSDADAVYILGDFFEFWVGDDDNSAFNQQIIAALWQLNEQNVAVYIMRGNRDFLLGKQFAKQCGATLIEDPTLIDCYEQKVLLLHGDSLCTLDTKHQAFRRKTHNPLYIKLFGWLPLWLRRRIAKRVRYISYQRGMTLPDDIMDVTDDEVVNQIRHYKADLMIHGHTHRPAIHQHPIDGKDIPRVVLGSWHHNGCVLKLSANQAPSLTDVVFIQATAHKNKTLPDDTTTL
ncbi:MAG: UDP-2,3-diacylglucosamine diphosphatase [Coxiellaceae bacterium]|nr:UDP-2,3-diacylglucosamine diphosphatase [Coxiellaceae bacterium]